MDPRRRCDPAINDSLGQDAGVAALRRFGDMNRPSADQRTAAGTCAQFRQGHSD